MLLNVRKKACVINRQRVAGGPGSCVRTFLAAQSGGIAGALLGNCCGRRTRRSLAEWRLATVTRINCLSLGQHPTCALIPAMRPEYRTRLGKCLSCTTRIFYSSCWVEEPRFCDRCPSSFQDDPGPRRSFQSRCCPLRLCFPRPDMVDPRYHFALTQRSTAAPHEFCAASECHFRHRPGKEVGGLMRKRERASPRFWMNASELYTSAPGCKLPAGATGSTSSN